MSFWGEDIDVAMLARALQLMEALERQGGTPIGALDFHAFAYLANVLSPLWAIEPIDDTILKDKTKLGPYYPKLQRALEALVGKGLVEVVELRNTKSISEFSMRATFRLASRSAGEILGTISELPDERDTGYFLQELAASFLEIQDDKRDDAAALDATFSDPAVASDRVIDFGEFAGRRSPNPSWNTAETFQRYAPKGVTLNRAEKLAMYVRLLKRRAHG